MREVIKVKITKNRFKVYSNKAHKAYTQALDDCVDDVIRTSSESAPHLHGILEKSHDKQVKYTKNKPTAIVSYSVKNKSKKGNFNYALKMHNGTYNLGEKSRRKKGGVGMSGKRYPVGQGYLGNVVKGEQKTYIKHIEKELKRFSKAF